MSHHTIPLHRYCQPSPCLWLPWAGPTLLIIIPLVSVPSITFLRQNHGLHMQFDAHITAGETMMMLEKALTIQLVFRLNKQHFGKPRASNAVPAE